MINKLKKFSKLDILKFILGIIFIFISLKFIIFYGNKINIGRIIVFMMGNLFILSVFLKSKIKKIFNIILFIIIIIYLVSLLIISFGFKKYDNNYENQTIIILGAGIKQDKPGLDLTSRLYKAIEVLNKNPNSNCIVTGGFDKKYKLYESDIMKNYLILNGISEDRIFQEKISSNTKENFIYAKEIIEKYNFNKNVIVITNFYHQFRASLYAKSMNLQYEGVSSFSKPSDFLCSSVREVFGIIKFLLFE